MGNLVLLEKHPKGPTWETWCGPQAFPRDRLGPRPLGVRGEGGESVAP